MNQDIQQRTFDFGLRIIKLAMSLPNTRVCNVLGKQVLRAGTSIGANVEEAHAGYSRDDFIFRLNIALKEARETHYWLRLIASAEIVRQNRLEAIIKEAEELKKILGAIVSKTRGTSKKQN